MTFRGGQCDLGSNMTLGASYPNIKSGVAKGVGPPSMTQPRAPTKGIRPGPLVVLLHVP